MRNLLRITGLLEGGEKAYLSWRIFLFAVLLLVLHLLYPHPPSQRPILKKGDISSRDVIAPFNFPILKTDEELSLEREAVAEGVLPVVVLDEEKSQGIRERIKAFSKELGELKKKEASASRSTRVLKGFGLTLTEETSAVLLSPEGKKVVEEVEKVVEAVLARGLLQDKGTLPLGRERRVSLKAEGKEYAQDLEEILDTKEAGVFLKENGLRLFSEEEDCFKAFVELATNFLKPNLVLDIEETERRRITARAEVKTSKGLVLKGEMIVRAHDPVTKDVADKLRSLNLGLGSSGPPSVLLPTLGRIVIFALILALFSAYLFFSQASVFAACSHLLLLSLLGVVMVCFSSLTISLEGLYYYLVPMAFASTLVALLLNMEVALYFTVTVSLLLAVYSGMRLAGPLVGLLGGTVAVLSVRGLKSRTQFYRSILLVSGANIVAIVAIELFRSSPVSLLGRGCLLGALNGFGSIFLAIGFLPVFERLFKVTTNITLLELSDLNRPILRRLAFEASGTYHHSLVVASLSEAAAQAIGANSLLARVASYYHDIGKLKKPEYFVENQAGLKNPHDKLTPRMSSLIVSAHVKDGVELAKEERLPKEIADVISKHHGTTLMVPFYERAKAVNSQEKVSDTDFRYPGPRPQGREVAVVMLADAVEATARSLTEPTTSRLKGVIKSVIDSRLMEGELSDSGLTLKDLHKIGEAFLPILIGVFHPRLDYPREKKDEDSSRESKGGKARKGSSQKVSG